jgi:DHA1 family bicyclomycin/chloramphenicol resistance-like MFS transporter
MRSRTLDIILAALALLGPFAIHLFFPVIPVVKQEFGLADWQAQLTFSIGVFGLAASTLLYGPYADRYGRRPVLLAGLTLFTLGSIMSGLADSFSVLLLGRVVQAVGAGCGITLARAIARDVYGDTGMVKAIAYLSMCFAVGGLLSPGLGGILIDTLSWRSVFTFTALAGAAMMAAVYLRTPETRGPGAPGHASMLHGVLELVRQPRFCALIVHSGCTTGTFMVVATASSTLMKELLQRPATEFGLYFAMVPLGFIMGSFLSTRLGMRVSVERMVMTGACLSATAVLVQSALLLTGHLHPLVLFLPGSFITMAQGISLPYAQAGAMATIPRLAGTSAGLGVFAQNFVGAGFAQLYGVLADGTTAPLMQVTAITAGLAFVTAAIPAVMLRSGRRA